MSPTDPPIIRQSSANPAPGAVLVISRWDEVFECAKTRKLVRLQYVQTPSGVDSAGYLELATCHGPAGWIALGIFGALCQLTATWERARRGKFLKTNGSPMSLAQIAALIRADLPVFEAAVALLLSEEVGWLRWESANHPPVSRQSSADNPPPDKNRVEGSREEEIGGEGDAPARAEAQAPESAEDPTRIPRAGFPNRQQVLDYAASRGWDTKAAVAFWLHHDDRRSQGNPYHPDWHWWSKLEKWILDDARGAGRGPGRNGGAPTAKKGIEDYVKPEDWTEDNISLRPMK